MKFKEVERILIHNGWHLVAQHGSHCQYKHYKKVGRVTVPKHNGDLNPTTVKSIWKQAGIEGAKTI